MWSVDLFFCPRIRLTISSLSEGGQKNEFPHVIPGNSMEIYLSEEYSNQGRWPRLKNNY